MSLELAAAIWLKWDKRCPLVITERSPRELSAGKPDVLGINPARFMLEIEVKRSLSDFRANMRKRHIENRLCLDEKTSAHYIRMAPRQFWFMVPKDLVEKCEAELPPFAGLMTTASAELQVKVIKPSPTNQLSQKISLKECAKLVHLAGNQLLGLYTASKGVWRGQSDSTWCDNFYHRPWTKECDYENYQI